MKKNLLLLLAFGLASFSLSAQKYNPPIPAYRDTVLISVIKKQYYKKGTQDVILENHVSGKAYRDTIMPIFSQFAVGNNAYAKNANVLTAEVASKDTRLSYNAAAYSKDSRRIYNVELFAVGKDDVSSIFSKTKLKGVFGINVSSSFLFWSSMYFTDKDKKILYDGRSAYAWTLENRADQSVGIKQKKLVEEEIARLEALNKVTTLPEFSEQNYSKILKLRDSLETLKQDTTKEVFYERKLSAYDTKFAKWNGFNIFTVDLKAGIANEGYSYYQMIDQPVVYPVINENGKRFTRWSFGAAGNFIHSGPWIATKTTLGVSVASFIGFDGEAADEFTQTTSYDSLNVSRVIEKKYTAYQLKDKMLDTYHGMVFSLNQQMFFGKKKLFGFGFNSTCTDFLNGQYNGKVGIDNSYSLLIALSKKGDLLNKNVLAINFKTPDILEDLPKSYDNKTGAKLRTRDKLEIGITFGFTIDKLLGK